MVFLSFWWFRLAQASLGQAPPRPPSNFLKNPGSIFIHTFLVCLLFKNCLFRQLAWGSTFEGPPGLPPSFPSHLRLPQATPGFPRLPQAPQPGNGLEPDPEPTGEMFFLEAGRKNYIFSDLFCIRDQKYMFSGRFFGPACLRTRCVKSLRRGFFAT